MSAVANIGREGQDLRIRRGVIAATIAIGLTGALLELDVPIVYRLIVFVPFFGALNLLYQGLFKT